jgi:hypothetical protein
LSVAGRVAASVVAAVAFAGCAKSPTLILTHVDVDETAPAILVMRATLASVSDQSKVATSSFVSLAAGDASDLPAPYRFPLELPLYASPTFAGGITVTIEGLDYATGTVVARGTTSAQVVTEQQTRASLTLTAVAPVGGDAGALDGAAADGAAEIDNSDGGTGSDGGLVSDDAAPDL